MDVPTPRHGTPAATATTLVRDAALAAVEDLQRVAPDLGWGEATGLADGVVDALSHLLVDLADGATTPTARPLVVGAIAGPAAAPDHASCRSAAATLRRVAPVLRRGAAELAWAAEAGEVALDLAELLDQVADQARSGRLALAHKGVVVRRLHVLQRRLQALG